MLKDIPNLVVENIVIAVVPETNESNKKVWNVYLVNLYDKGIENVMVSSKGYGTFQGREVKTSVLRHMIGNIDSHDYAKIEPILTDLFALSNEYWISFYLDKQIYDKKYVFLPEAIKEENFSLIPVLNLKGVMIR